MINPDVLNSLAKRDVPVDDLSFHSRAYEEAGKQMGINLSKRLKEYVSPGNRLANSFGKDSIQIMLSDKEVSSAQLLFYTRSLYPKEWRKYQKDVEEFVTLDNMRPEDRTETEGHESESTAGIEECRECYRQRCQKGSG